MSVDLYKKVGHFVGQNRMCCWTYVGWYNQLILSIICRTLQMLNLSE